MATRSKHTTTLTKRSPRLSGTFRQVVADMAPGALQWKPEPYMLEAVGFLLEQACAGLFLDPGLRKTSITLAAIKVLKKEGLMRSALVVAPLRVCYSVWPKEAKKWKDFAGLRVEVLHGPKKEEAASREADIYVINPEGLEWLFGVTKTTRVTRAGSKRKDFSYDLARFKAMDCDLLVVDEVSKFKNYASDRLQMMKPLLGLFARRWGLTGSPASNGLMGLFGIMYMIDQGKALGQYITHYRNAFFMPQGYGGYSYVLRPGAEERIYAAIAPYVFRLKAEDYIKLPELVVNKIEVELPPEARRIYDELEDDFITLFGDEAVMAANTGAALTKCRQVANGGIYLTPEVDEKGRKASKREWRHLHTAKVEAVQDVLEELGGSPAIVTYDFAHDLERLLKGLGKDSAVIGQGTAREDDKLIERWNRGELPWLITQLSAMSHGINAQEGNAQHIVMPALTYDFEVLDQLVRRLRRSGNTAKHVFLHLIVAKDTVDEAMWAATTRKDGTQGAFLDAMGEYTRQRAASKKKRR